MTKKIRKHSELIFWIMAVVALAFTNPAAGGHYSLCIFRLAGFDHCPGCGIGHSISWLFRGEFKASLQAHWLGLPALLIIFYRIVQLSFGQLITFRKLNLNPRHGI